MKIRDVIRFAVATLLALLAHAQVGASRIEGTIVDPSGAFVSGATIKARNERTGQQATAASDARGFFVLPSVVPGPYQLTVEAPGFRTEVVTGIAVGIAATATVRVGLLIGAATESITVEADQRAVNLSDAQGGGVVDQRDIDALPQIERNPVRLAILQPGVQISAGTLGLSRINGTRQGSQAPRLDGVDAGEPMAPGLGFIGVLTSDSIQEFRVLTHSAKAEYGRSGGAQIEMVSRSGTNVWHTSLYHFHRNTALNANDFFNNSIAAGPPRPKLIYNNFGGTVGGPVRRDRTFFFASYNGSRVRQDTSRNRLVLTAEARAGVFRWPAAAGVQYFDIIANDPRRRGIDPMIARELALLPLPNNAHMMGDGLNADGYRFNNPTGSSKNTMNGRIDHSVRERLRLFLRLTSLLHADNTDVINSADAVFPGQPQGRIVPSTGGIAFGANWTISPRAVGEIRVGRQSVGGRFERPARLDSPMIVATSWTSPLNPDFNRERNTRIHSVAGTLTHVRASHIFKAGFEARSLRIHSVSSNGIYPNVFLNSGSFNSIPAGIGPTPATPDFQRFADLYNHLLGRISRVEQTFYTDLRTVLGPGIPRERNFQAPEAHGFFQDDWRLRHNLTLSLGVRYELYGVPTERDGLQGTFDRAGALGATTQIADLTVTRTGSWYEVDRNNFGSRAGLVWDPSGKGKTAIRASYGIYYDPMIGNVVAFLDERTPGFAHPQGVTPNSLPGSDHRLSDGIPLPVRPPQPVLRAPADRSTDAAAVLDPRLRTGYLQQYSVSVQRQLGDSMAVEAAWVGNRGIKLLHQTMPNQRRINGGFLDAFRELQAFRATGKAPSPANTLVRLFGTPLRAVTAISDSVVEQGAAGAAADRVDLLNHSLYPAAGLSPFYIRNYPQFNMLFVGTNDGRSYYDSLQLSLRRRAGAARFDVHYTFSKTIDLLSNSGAAIDSVIDQFNLRLNRARANFDRSHVLSGFALWALPFGKGHRLGARWPGWLESAAGGWEVSGIGVWESGSPFTVRTGRQTAGAGVATFSNYSGDRNIGRVERRGDGVYFFTPEEIGRFSYPAAGEIGTAGRNTFRGPRLFNIDLSVGKHFRIKERQDLSFRAEAYNLFNNPNFGFPGGATPAQASLTVSELGKITFGLNGLAGAPIGETFGGPRVVQLSLRWGF
jgi:hypothetical protein